VFDVQDESLVNRVRSNAPGLVVLWPSHVVYFLLVCFLFQSAAAAQVKPVKRVLILNELGSWSPGVNVIDQQLFTTLRTSPYQIEFYEENLDTNLFPGDESQQELQAWYFRKYRDRKPDLIIAVGPAPLAFMVKSHEAFAPGTPVVFWTSTEELAEPPKLDSSFTGVWGVAQPEKTLQVALQLEPATKNVVVVGGTAPYDRYLETLVKKSFRKYESSYDFTYLTDLDMPALLERLKNLPPHTIVYHTSIMQDGAGTRFVDAIQSVPLVAAAANAPVFVVDDVDVGRGTVGGYVFSFELGGKAVADMALRIIKGEKPENIPMVRNANTYLFDWQALRRWRLKENELPAGSIVVNKELSLWERNRNLLIAVILITLVLSSLVVYLQYSRKQLIQARDAQSRLSRLLINSQEQERRRLASELHDDFSQRVALIALDLECASDEIPDFLQSTKKKLLAIWNSVGELGTDLHTVSHRLHSSTLETLGLVPGVTALCEEFSARQSVEVVLSTNGVLGPIPFDVSLCLYRVVQEGLRNIKKHSGAARAEIKLSRIENTLVLILQDYGCGFDLRAINNREGIGIQSMTERVHQLGGEFEIVSEPGKGTSIQTTVPVHPETVPARANPEWERFQQSE
jgi:signal transduction histidine kinase